MKKLFVLLTLFAMLFSMVGCTANKPEPGLTAATGEPYDPAAGKFPEPPKGYVVTEDGTVPLRLGGYNWSYETGHGTGSTFHADQAIWPLPLEDMETVKIVPKDLLDGSTYYLTDPPILINQGAKVVLDWQVMPDVVECTFWPADHETTGAPERKMECKKDGFIAHMGDYIYEFSAAWGNHGGGYSGKATFYVHVIVEMEG